MQLLKTEKQKDNLAKFSYDISKIIFAITVVGPITKPEFFNLFLFFGGLIAIITSFLFGYILDSKEIIS